MKQEVSTGMKIKTFGRHSKEAFKNIGRNGWMSFASISAVTVTLLLVGVFLTLVLNLNAFGDQLEEDVEIRTFIDLTAEKEQQDELKAKIENISEVESVTFQSKEEGLDNLIDNLGDQGEVFESLKDENPLSDEFVVKTSDPQDINRVADQIKQFEYVENVEFGQETVNRLFKVLEISRNVGLGLVIGLLFTAMFLISNTIKLTIVARRTEIEIMKLVGATNWFIRWPFLIEGVLIGIFGALIPIGVLIYGYYFLTDLISTRYPTFFIDLLPVTPFVYQLAALLVVLGVIIGVWGSLTSMRKFLKV